MTSEAYAQASTYLIAAATVVLAIAFVAHVAEWALARGADMEPTGAQVAAGGPIITPEQKAQLIKEAQALVDAAKAKGATVQFPSPYEFMNNFSYSMTAIGPPWSEMTAYDLNTVPATTAAAE